MRQYVQKNKLATFILATSLVQGGYLRVWGLAGGKFLSTDEYRTILDFNKRVLATGPFLNLVYKIPMLIWGRSQHIVLYTTAFWGILSILMVFVIGRMLFNDKVGCYAALFISLSAVHVKYSRTGYAIVFQTFLLLIAFLFLVFYFKDEKLRFIIVSGGILGLAFLVYVPSYAAIVACLVLLPVILKSRGFSSKKIFSVAALLGIMVLMLLLVCEIVGRINTSSYFVELSDYKSKTSYFANVTAGKLNFSAPFEAFEGIARYGGGLQLWLMIIGVSYCIVVCFLKRDKRLFLLSGFICISFLVLYLMSLFAFHTVRLRRIVYLIPFSCICLSYLIYHVELVTNKYLAVLLLVIFSIYSFPKCFQVTKETFTMKPIVDWLERQKISRHNILSALDLSEDGDGMAPINIPLKYPNGNIIDWEKVKIIYRRKAMRYILVPGLLTPGQRTRPLIGNGDPVLKKVKPVKTWAHPYNIPNIKLMRSKAYGFDVQDFAIYDLEEIFK